MSYKALKSRTILALVLTITLTGVCKADTKKAEEQPNIEKRTAHDSIEIQDDSVAGDDGEEAKPKKRVIIEGGAAEKLYLLLTSSGQKPTQNVNYLDHETIKKLTLSKIDGKNIGCAEHKYEVLEQASTGEPVKTKYIFEYTCYFSVNGLGVTSNP